MTKHQKNYKGITYTVSQQTIDDLKKLHGVDAFNEIENMLDREIEKRERSSEIN
jgi:hypothetical protein